MRAARHFVNAELSRAGFADAAFTASLLVSELITNVLLHARTDTRIVIESQDGEDPAGPLRIAVHDTSQRPIARRRHRADSATGRGLMLVEQLAADWGVDSYEGGKAVWFVLTADADEAEPDEPDLDAFLALDSLPWTRPWTRTSTRRSRAEGSSPCPTSSEAPRAPGTPCACSPRPACWRRSAPTGCSAWAWPSSTGESRPPRATPQPRSAAPTASRSSTTGRASPSPRSTAAATPSPTASPLSAYAARTSSPCSPATPRSS